jgi:hypothetical protein
VIVLVGEDKAKNEEQREWWARRAPRVLASTVGPAVVATGILTGMFGSLAASTCDASPQALNDSIHSAKLRARLRRLRSSLGRPTARPKTMRLEGSTSVGTRVAA